MAIPQAFKAKKSFKKKRDFYILVVLLKEPGLHRKNKLPSLSLLRSLSREVVFPTDKKTPEKNILPVKAFRSPIRTWGLFPSMEQTCGFPRQ